MTNVAVHRTNPDTGVATTVVYSPAARFRIGTGIDPADGRRLFSGHRTKSLTAEEWLAGRVANGWTPCPPPFKIGARVPGLRSLRHWSFDGVARATDGCKIEPDGHCHHGAPSWLVALGVI